MSLILIVEDNEKNLKLARDLLEVKGYRTASAGSGEDGIRVAQERHPDAILMSAAAGEGIPEMLARVEEALSKKWLLREIDAPAAQAGSWTARLYESAQILNRKVLGDKIRFRLRVTAENWSRLQSLLTPAA